MKADWVMLGSAGVNGPLHAVPVGDTRDHELSLRCWCRPIRNGMVVLHGGDDAYYEDRRSAKEPEVEDPKN